jgi:hypothetical protein
MDSEYPEHVIVKDESQNLLCALRICCDGDASEKRNYSFVRAEINSFLLTLDCFIMEISVPLASSL